MTNTPPSLRLFELLETMCAQGQPFSLGDAIEATIDYHAVTMALTEMAEAGEWRLIEKLAEDAATLVLTKFQPDCVRVEVKKFILPQTRHVSVRIERRR